MPENRYSGKTAKICIMSTIHRLGGMIDGFFCSSAGPDAASLGLLNNAVQPKMMSGVMICRQLGASSLSEEARDPP